MKALWQISWWAAFILVLACLFLSLSYTFGEALFIATLYLPGIFLLRQWIPQLPARTTAESEWDEDEEREYQEKQNKLNEESNAWVENMNPTAQALYAAQRDAIVEIDAPAAAEVSSVAAASGDAGAVLDITG